MGRLTGRRTSGEELGNVGGGVHHAVVDELREGVHQAADILGGKAD